MARSSLNKVMLIGHLGGDPDVRTTPSGTYVANFNLATNRVWTNSEGERQEETDWHRVVAWGRLAETCGNYLKKGSYVYIEGRLQTRSWEGEDGARRYTTEVVAQNMIMLDTRGADVTGASEEGPPSEPSAEDDIPF